MLSLPFAAWSYARFDRWAYTVDWSAVALWITAVGTAILAAGVIVALWGLWDSRKTRDGELVTELSRRWNEEETLESKMAYTAHGPSGIVALLERLYVRRELNPRAPPTWLFSTSSSIGPR